ncbi:MAG: hypothetical protein KGD57_06020, partial [Candidatus Lokiarchaeota archaeon]|nr:hypothetical protein [Candidatus Lokiarchaeota archaeon]
MINENSDFIKSLMKIKTDNISVYCTGFPEENFMNIYQKKYNIYSDRNKDFFLKKKDYSLIKNIGFNAISIWDFRRGEGGYFLKNQNNKLKVDGWGRIYKNNWYTWD